MKESKKHIAIVVMSIVLCFVSSILSMSRLEHKGRKLKTPEKKIENPNGYIKRLLGSAKALILVLILSSCSPKVGVTVIEVLSELDEKHNLAHVENKEKNFNDVIPIPKQLKDGDKYYIRLPKEKDE